MRLLSPVVALGVLLVLTACGSGADPLAPQRADNGTDRQAARLADLRQADLPSGYRAHGSQQTGRRQCSPDLHRLTLTGSDVSRPFVAENRTSYALGEVDVYRTRAEAEEAFARITGTVRRGCLVRAARRAVAGYQGGSVHAVQLALPVNVFGGRILARRFAVRWRSGAERRSQYTDDVYLLAGRAVVVLSFWRSGRPFAGIDEARAVILVARRALGKARSRPGGNTTHGD